MKVGPIVLTLIIDCASNLKNNGQKSLLFGFFFFCIVVIAKVYKAGERFIPEVSVTISRRHITNKYLERDSPVVPILPVVRKGESSERVEIGVRYY